ncbi:LysR substrate-binding domain-containing protein [Pseudophaeobacter sp.]|uniref:LysR substrate-binding domain-containing protein n=1 Tax=Pseudophaeobacter sp. TaxID=1971739 RepID=UPI003299AC5B
MRISTRHLPLTALRTFEAAARHLSFKEAAEELCVSATAVSNHVRQLEKDWDCKLFHRQTRAVTLTERGRSLSQVLTRSFADIRDEVENNVLTSPKRVTLAVGPIFGSRWLGPRLARFAKAHPEIELIVHHGPRITDAEQMKTDLAVDWGDGNWRNLYATEILNARYSPVISPDLAAQHPALTQPSQLAKLPILHQQDRSEWRNWFELAGCPDIDLDSEVIIEDSNMVQRAVKDGQGIALGVFPLMDAEVKSGQLIKPFDIDLLPSRSFYLLSRREVRKDATVQTVLDWIRDEVEQLN